MLRPYDYVERGVRYTHRWAPQDDHLVNTKFFWRPVPATLHNHFPMVANPLWRFR